MVKALHLPIAAICICLVSAAVLRASPDQPIVEPLDVMIGYAQGGDPTAQFNLALRYGSGDGVTQDLKSSEQWYRRSAQAGYAPSQFNLAVLLANGKDVAKDDKEAAKWLFMAAQQGLFEAQKLLMEFYIEGRGVEKNPAKALTWDFLARRTLELRETQRAGEPPHPPMVRKDGAAEIVQPDGTKKIVHADGAVESAGSDGKRILTYSDGRTKEILADGTEITRTKEGFEETRFPDGRITRRDPKGTAETTFPDGHTELEGGGTDSAGRAVRITEVKDKSGKRISRRIVRENRTVYENETRAYLVETVFTDARGIEVKLSETVEPDGKLRNGKLTQTSDGAGPKGAEQWTIKRIIEPGPGQKVLVQETYSEDGLQQQNVIKEPPKNSMVVTRGGFVPSNTAIPANMPMVYQPEIRTATVTVFGGNSGPRASLFKEKTDLQPMLKELEELEAKARNFAGASEREWAQGKAAAQTFAIPFINPPQKPGATPNWLTLRTMTQNSLPEGMLKPSNDDGSRQYPFGYHGKEVIKLQPWRHSQTAHFIVHYIDEADARVTMQYIEGAYAVIRNLLGLDPLRGTQKSHVFLYPSKQSWQDYLAKSNNSSRLAGFAYKNELLLPIVTAGAEQGSSIKTLCHEATHAIIAIFYPGRKPPLWLNEGFAEYVAARTVSIKGGPTMEKASPSKNQQAAAQRAAASSGDINVADLFRRIRYEATASEPAAPNGVRVVMIGGGGNTQGTLGTFYPDSERCVVALCEKLPIDGFPKFFNAIVAGNSPDIAFPIAYGPKCPSVDAFSKLVNGK
jgi:hypothetical protein